LSRLVRDRVLSASLRGAALVAGAIVVLIVVFLVLEALPALRNVGLGSFFTDEAWRPSEQLYNLTPMLWGSLLVTAGAVLVATPLGILSAIFCRFYAPPAVASVYRRLIELLAGIPSVIYGLWGLVVLVPLIGSIRAPGTSLLAGILILAIMITPIIAMLADSALGAVPLPFLHGAAGLGLSRAAIIWHIVLPNARSGLITAVILATGRALGETMAVLMVCGNAVETPGSLFDSVRALTANIALEMAYAMGDHRSALFVSGLILTALIMGLILAAEVVSRRTGHE
jgi:phosphate transport system permease protein